MECSVTGAQRADSGNSVFDDGTEGCVARSSFATFLRCGRSDGVDSAGWLVEGTFHCSHPLCCRVGASGWRARGLALVRA